ncbi:hypothetical protein CRUP_028001, partial [Coryphaenoides rupestris]
VAGGVVMAVGVWTLVEKSDYISLLSSKSYAASAYILVLAGAIVMVTGVLGCCATFKEQRRLLRVVSVQGVVACNVNKVFCMPQMHKYPLSVALGYCN